MSDAMDTRPTEQPETTSELLNEYRDAERDYNNTVSTKKMVTGEETPEVKKLVQRVKELKTKKDGLKEKLFRKVLDSEKVHKDSGRTDKKRRSTRWGPPVSDLNNPVVDAADMSFRD